MDAGLGAGAPARAHIVACAGCFCAVVYANGRAMSRSGHMGAAILRPIGRGEGAGARARAAAQSAPQDADPIWASALLCSGELFASRLFVIFSLRPARTSQLFFWRRAGPSRRGTAARRDALLEGEGGRPRAGPIGKRAARRIFAQSGKWGGICAARDWRFLPAGRVLRGSVWVRRARVVGVARKVHA